MGKYDNKLTKNYVERVYAGILGKAIGVRYGEPVEMWTYEKIKRVYGELDGYVTDSRGLAADDDINGTFFFIRALEDYTYKTDISPEQIGRTWLNYVPYEHGFFWWGGYGISSEHTAYHNLINGIAPPRSGSMEQNGLTIAEQIGGQIFIDAWGLVAANNPRLAAEYAQKAASVGHDGNAKYGGMFVAACISAAFAESDMEKVIEEGLGVIPTDCDYAAVVRFVVDYYHRNPSDWEMCLVELKKNFWTDKYGGHCHVIPNTGIMILSMLYGKGDFSRALSICVMCGFDTDCNAANVGAIMGVAGGLQGIDHKKWISGLNDFFPCSSVTGSLNMLDLASFALYLAAFGYKIAEQKAPDRWRGFMGKSNMSRCFELPGSTHGVKAYVEGAGSGSPIVIMNTDRQAASGQRSLRVACGGIDAGESLNVYLNTYYGKDDFTSSKYSPAFSPMLYPGQTIKMSVMPDMDNSVELCAQLYIKDTNNEKLYGSEKTTLKNGVWSTLEFTTPIIEGGCIKEAGISLAPRGLSTANEIVVYLDDIEFSGKANYSIDFSKEKNEQWSKLCTQVSQFTYLKGLWRIEDGVLSGSCSDFGEAYTGDVSWRDYTFSATIIPQLGSIHNILFRVQGAVRLYSVGLAENGKLVLCKKNLEYSVLNEIDFPWSFGNSYTITVLIKGNKIRIEVDGKVYIEYTDNENPYLYGQIGAGVRKGSHCQFSDFRIS